MALLNALTRINNLIGVVTRNAMTMIVLGVLVLMTINVFMRYGIGQALRWGEELCSVALVWMVFLGSGNLSRVGKHLSVETIHDLLPPKAQQVLMIIVNLTTVAVALFLAWLAFDQVLHFYEKHQILTASRLPTFIAYSPLPVGFFLIALGTLESLLKIIFKKG